MREVHEQYRQREESLAVACQSPESMTGYVQEVRRCYLDILGEMPEKTPLQVQVTDVEHQPGFRMEKIVFQSMPVRYVTASLYLSEGKGKHAVTVSLCGHGLHGKRPGATPVLLARNGIATLVIDPIGQGERWQFINEKGEYATRGATTEHTLLNAGCVAVGTSRAALQCWDNHRAIDYLVSRADMDADRIGVWGNSGGGTETTYLIGMDEWVKAAAICSYFSQRERTLELQGPSDGCQHIPREGAEPNVVSAIAFPAGGVSGPSVGRGTAGHPAKSEFTFIRCSGAYATL
ncbi:MAG: acetylxylan esterase [Bacteroides sp.]|nr:acetylxylan esterase [Bacteroides sp.]